MTVTEFNGLLYVPRPPIRSQGVAPVFSSTIVIDGANEIAGFHCDAPATGNIRKIHWRTATVTTGATITVGIYQIDRTATPAMPSTTPWNANSNASVVVADANDNVVFETTLTADAAVTKGDPIAVAWVNPAASFGNIQIATIGVTDDSVTYPYISIAGGVNVRTAVVALEYDDGNIYPIPSAIPASALTTTTFSSGSTPDTIGERFQLTAPMRCSGFWLLCDSDDDFTVKIVTTAYHQANGTGILASRTVKKEDRSANGAARYQEWVFPAAVELSKATNYRWLIEPGATGITIYDFSVNSLALLDAISGGRNWHLTTAKDPTADGSFTNYNSGTFRRLWGGLIFDASDDGAGGGSGGGERPTLLGGILQ